MIPSISTVSSFREHYSTNMATKVIEMKVDPGRLKNLRGVVCGLLPATFVTTVICLSVFNSAEASNLFQCYLFRQSTPQPSACQFVIAGSVIVMLVMAVLFVETISALFCAFAFTE